MLHMSRSGVSQRCYLTRFTKNSEPLHIPYHVQKSMQKLPLNQATLLDASPLRHAGLWRGGGGGGISPAAVQGNSNQVAQVDSEPNRQRCQHLHAQLA